MRRGSRFETGQPTRISLKEILCTAYDRGTDGKENLRLSSIAQRYVFALRNSTTRSHWPAWTGYQVAPPGGRMHRLLTTLARGFKERIGWKRLGIVASLVIIAFAITTLIRTLKGVDTSVILTALTEISPRHIALAGLCVIGAFCTLTLYDLFALRTIGKKHVPYRIAAMSSFASYSIGHNVGATVFTGGAIRFRIYSDYVLNAIDVAKICFLSGLPFWLGNNFVFSIG